MKKKKQHHGVEITDHAIVRYLERHKGIDMNAIRSEILTETTTAYIQQLGDGKYPIGDGRRLVVKNKTVVTVI